MGLESLPSVVFLLLPGFLSWFIFCWGTVTRKISQVQHLFISLLLSVLAFSIAYPLINLFKLLAINTFAPSWNIKIFPGYMGILSNPEMLSLELLIAIYVLAVLLGFLLIRMYKKESVTRLFNQVGLDLHTHEDAWYRLFHKNDDYVTVYLKDGNIVSGWPTYYSQSGDKETAELYLSKMHYYQKDKQRWVKSSRSVEGLLINTDSISHIEFRKPEVVRETETGGSQAMKDTWQPWLEYCARFIVWIGGLLFATMTVLGWIPILPEDTSIQLMLFLYLFLIAALITWLFDIYQSYPPRRKRAKK
ncbi:hypothetical protein ES703_10673 [subsurface metagenome]